MHFFLLLLGQNDYYITTSVCITPTLNWRAAATSLHDNVPIMRCGSHKVAAGRIKETESVLRLRTPSVHHYYYSSENIVCSHVLVVFIRCGIMFSERIIREKLRPSTRSSVDVRRSYHYMEF